MWREENTMLMNSNEYLHIVESIKQDIRTAQYPSRNLRGHFRRIWLSPVRAVKLLGLHGRQSRSARVSLLLPPRTLHSSIRL